VLLYAVVAVFLLAALVLAGSNRIEALERAADVRFAVDGQARQVAKSGLLHATAWLRSQPSQPVTAFAPARDLAAAPPVDETDDPAVGLVRSFQIAPGLWGRYTVARGAQDEGYTDRNRNGLYDAGEPFDDADGNGRHTLAWGARDASSRYDEAPGMVWRLESLGEIFARPRADLALGEGPNARLAAVTIAADVRRSKSGLTATAALVTSEAEETKVKSKVVLTSPTLGLGYRKLTGAPEIHSKAKIQAPTPHAGLVGLREGDGSSDKGVKDPIQVEEVFGADLDAMKATADVLRTVPAKPDKTEPDIVVPDMATMVVTVEPTKSRKAKGLPGLLKLKSKMAIGGRGILIIDADVEIYKDRCDFEGLLFVTGRLTFESSHVSGMVVAAGETEITGAPLSSGGRHWHIQHDPVLVAQLLGLSGDYYQRRAAWQPAPRREDGLPLEELLREDRGGAASAP
jgi:hypothetical protein